MDTFLKNSQLLCNYISYYNRREWKQKPKKLLESLLVKTDALDRNITNFDSNIYTEITNADANIYSEIANINTNIRSEISPIKKIIDSYTYRHSH